MSTYTPIASATIGTATNSVTFAGIPQTYSDLMVVVYGQASGSNLTGVAFTCNGDTATNYSYTRLYGNDLNVVSTDTASGATRAVFGFVSGFFDTTVLEIADYTNTNTYKSARSRSGINDYGRYVFAYTNRYASTNAITSLTILTDNSAINFTTGTTIGIYGIANASISNTAKATGGDSIYTDGTYWYHTFLSSGTFTPTQSLTADFLVVAGGGGGAAVSSGGNYSAPGGGAGGYKSSVGSSGGGGAALSPLSLTAQNYTVTIGAGGAGNAVGSASVFGSVNTVGGGQAPSGNGGSGGGAFDFGTLTPGTGATNEGYAGGAAAGPTSAGGGGGAGGVGSTARTGGAGITSSISGSSVARAGGGGAGWGGTASAGGGAGGAASTTQNGSAATANTGGGGGGASVANGSASGGAGGSGIVIVRYAV